VAWNGEAVQRRVAIGGDVLPDHAHDRSRREAVERSDALDRRGEDAPTAGVEPLPLARDVERQLVDRTKRSEEADIAAVADAPVPEVDRLPGGDVHPDARHAARRIVLNVEDAVGLLEKSSADELLFLRIEADEEVEILHAEAVHAEGSRAEDRVAAGVLLFLHEETRPHIAKHLAVLGIEVKAEDAEVIAIAGLRDEAEVGAEITADVLRGHA